MDKREKFNKLIGGQIRQIRKNNGLTLIQFGKKSGLNLDGSTISGIESGKQNLSAYQVFVLCRTMGVDIKNLLDLDLEEPNLTPVCIVCNHQDKLEEFDSSAWWQIDIKRTYNELGDTLIWICPNHIERKKERIITYLNIWD